METLLTNGLTLWLRWMMTKIIFALKYAGKHLRIEYMAEIKNCQFEEYNTIYKYAIVRNTNLGSFTYVARNSFIQNTNIGKFCCIGPNVKMGLGDHPSHTFVSSHPLFYSTAGQSSGLNILDKNLFQEYQTTTIGNDVWIGANVIIKSGVKIGNGAIIGSGAVVTKDVEPYSVIGGVPAKHLKYRFEQQQIDFLQSFNWWDKDLEWIKNNKHLFLDIQHLQNTYSNSQA